MSENRTLYAIISFSFVFFLFKANLVLYILQQTILVDETCVQKSEEKS